MLLEKGSRKQRHVLIADGMTHIGTAVVQSFAERGATSAFFCGDRFNEALILSRDTGALNIKCNVFNPESLGSAMEVADAFFEHRLDTVICNVELDLPETLNIQDFNKTTEILHRNIDSIRSFLSSSLSMMQEGGKVVFLLPALEQYGDSKRILSEMMRGMLERMIESAAPFLVGCGIRMNGIAVGRNISPDMAAKAIRFLASSESEGMTGKIIQL